jgi:protein tyrosine phosphatase (PTP) superfamily phosphohydrolase (DUF442 family)
VSGGAGVGIGIDANRPEVLTPQNPPVDPMPNGSVMPPNASGYAPGNGLRAAEYAPMYGARTNEEPPLARSTPKDAPPRVLQLPPDLLARKVAENIAPTSVPETPPGAPIGIDLFSEVTEKAIATGLKPELEGLDWLKNNKYHTVIQLRRAGVDDSADREQIERRGMKYIAIEMTPATLSKEMVEQFATTIGDAANQPVFVYDRDRVLAGAMWYLHLRLNEKMPEELARGRAELYGLKDKGTDESAAFWAKMQELLK